MDVREARLDDAEGSRRAARDSFAASYADVFDEATIDRVVDAEFSDDAVASVTDDPDQTLLVAVDESVAGVAHGRIVGTDPVVGDVRWLHVHPDHRDEDVGVRLLGALVQHFEAEDAALVRGRVLSRNDAGAGFYETVGFERRGTERLEIAGEDYEETVYEHRLGEDVGEEITDVVDGPDGESLVVDYSGGDGGTEAPFYPLYTDDSLDDRYGWRCGNCGSMETTMDADGRVQCAACDNERTPTRWDAAYL